MCGVAGIVYRDGRPVDRGLVQRMGACLRHRGPDDEGEYTDGGAGIAHTRLSIIDLSESGRQPMRSDDGRYVVAYNGEVYNFRELRQTLERCGHEFRGRSDTEVVLRAFIEWGESSFAKLEGMFAMAVWDSAERRLHLVSDVPVGVFLSEGIDSSAITAFAARHYGGRLKTFSAGFDFDRGVNELPKARKVAEHFGTDHHELQGDGGDEVHSLMAIQRWATMFARATSWASPMVPDGVRYYGVIQRLDNPDLSLKCAMVLADRWAGQRPASVFAPGARSMLEASDPFARYREMYRRFAGLDAVQRTLYTDCAVILPDLYFEKVDKATMAHGVEVRVPLVDTWLAAYVMGLPAKYKVRWLHKKRILRRALRGVVPDEILGLPKIGFGVPASHWLRTTLAGYMRDVLLDDTRSSASLFDAAALRTLVDDHVEGRRDSGTYLYRLLNLALWYDEYGVAA